MNDLTDLAVVFLYFEIKHGLLFRHSYSCSEISTRDLSTNRKSVAITIVDNLFM